MAKAKTIKDKEQAFLSIPVSTNIIIGIDDFDWLESLDLNNTPRVDILRELSSMIDKILAREFKPNIFEVKTTLCTRIMPMIPQLKEALADYKHLKGI